MNSPARVVTVLGSLHYDIMVVAPDRPRKGETVTGRSWHPKCGGKGGNQAVAAAKAGAKTFMIGAVGADDFGQALLANLDRRGVDRSAVRVADSAGSGMSVAIFDADGDYGAVIVSGSNLTLGPDDVEAADGLIARTSILLLQNEVPDTANIAAAGAVKAAGGRVIFNAAPARPLPDALKALVDVLVVNAIEAEYLAGTPVIDTLDGAADAAGLLLSHFPSVVVTAGGEGVAYADRSGLTFALPGIRVKVESTHGAGDEFIGAMAAALARGAATRDAVSAGNAAAATLVGTPESERG